MKNLCKLFLLLIFFICISETSFADNKLKLKTDENFYPTQADMLNQSANDVRLSDANFEKICINIIKNFKADKNFVRAFNEDKTEFLKYRLLQRDLILPAIKTDSTAYGNNYGIYSDSYLIELNKEKINSYKKAIELYCLYNDVYQVGQSCSKKNIKAIFN